MGGGGVFHQGGHPLGGFFMGGLSPGGSSTREVLHGGRGVFHQGGHPLGVSSWGVFHQGGHPPGRFFMGGGGGGSFIREVIHKGSSSLGWWGIFDQVGGGGGGSSIREVLHQWGCLSSEGLSTRLGETGGVGG